MYLLRVEQDKDFLEVRKWTGSFIQHVLFHLLKSEAGRQNHVHVLPTQFLLLNKNKHVRKFGTLKRLHEDVRLEKITAEKKRLKLKVNEL